jgi:heat shock protein HslJ
MHSRMFWLRLVGGASAVWLVVACGTAPTGSRENAGQATPATVTPAATSASELEGTEWRLVEYGPTDAPVAALADPPVTVRFEAGGKVGGSGGCNSYGGTYELDGQSLTVGEIASTMMACADATAMQQETTYLGALGSATRLERADDELIVDYDGGKLRFARR